MILQENGARRLVRAAFIFALSLLLVAWPRAAVAGDPDLEWWTIETPHFRVHHPRELEPIAARVASLGEIIHDRLRVSLGFTPKDVTHIVLTDDTDTANGSATAIPYNQILLYVTAPADGSALGDYDDWMLGLVTHEYTHILHTDNISGVPAIVNAIIGKSYAPNQIQPRWIIEGLAVVEESRHTSGGRIRSTIYDMYLRADVLEDNIAGLDQISSDAIRWPQGSLWYLYGSRFLRWITDVYGPDTMRAVSSDHGSTLVPWGFNRSIRRATGRTYVELYEGFVHHLKKQYAEQVRDVESRGLREGSRLTWHGRNASYPRFVPRELRSGPVEEIVYYRDDFDERSGIYRIPIGTRKEVEKRARLVARTRGVSHPGFTPSGDLVFNSVSTFRNLYDRNDLFALERGATSTQGDERARRRLTSGMRTESPDVSPDGRRIVFTVNTKGTTFLQIADIDGEGKLQNQRDLVGSARFEQAYTPRFSPDGRRVVYSAWTAGGYRDIRLVEVATGKFVELTRDRALDTNPIWSADGKTIYFSSDRTGIFNIYAFDLASKTLKQVTNVTRGAIQPAVSPDGKTLVYVGYTSEGYDLFSMKLDRTRFLEAPPAPTVRPDAPTEPSGVRLKKSRYNPLPTLRPHNYLFSIGPGVFGGTAVSVTVSGSDVVGHHSMAASLTAEPNAPSPAFSLDYNYSRLPVAFSLGAAHNVSPRGGYIHNGQEINYNEVSNSARAALAYSHSEDFGSHGFGLSLTVANFKGDLPVGSKLDPYAPVQPEPPAGNYNILHLGYSYSNVEGGFETPGAARGFYVSLGVDYADPKLGSTYSLRSASAQLGFYLPMPWPGRHTLASRTAGAISDGNYPYASSYFVGGYDLDNNDLPSTIASGVFNGAFVLRGYPPFVYAGREYLLQNFEYRFPIFMPDRGISTLPLFFRRIDGNLFIDYGGAFDHFDIKDIKFFHDGALIDSAQLHGSIGAELWFSFTLGYFLNTQLRLGYAKGFSVEALPAGQFYFVASGAF